MGGEFLLDLVEQGAVNYRLLRTFLNLAFMVDFPDIEPVVQKICGGSRAEINSADLAAVLQRPAFRDDASGLFNNIGATDLDVAWDAACSQDRYRFLKSRIESGLAFIAGGFATDDAPQSKLYQSSSVPLESARASPIETFLKECCVTDRTAEMRSSLLYEHYLAFAHELKFPPVSAKRFSMIVSSLG